MKTLRDGWYVAGADGHAVGPMTRAAMLDSHGRGAFPPDALAWHVEIAEWRPIEGAAAPTPAADAARSTTSAQARVAERVPVERAQAADRPQPKQSAAQRRAQAQQRRQAGSGDDDGKRLLSAASPERQRALAALHTAKASAAAAAKSGVAPKAAGAAAATATSQNAAAALECLRRFLARGIDTLTLGIVAAIIAWHYATRAAVQGPELASALVEAPAPVVQWMLAFVALVPLEALMLAVAGTTPGKALLGLRVLRIDGGRPGPATAFARALDVYVRGLALGIPVIAFFAMLIAGARRLNHGRTHWDQRAQLVVATTPLSAGRWQLALVAFVAAWVALGAGLWEQLLYGSGLLR